MWGCMSIVQSSPFYPPPPGAFFTITLYTTLKLSLVVLLLLLPCSQSLVRAVQGGRPDLAQELWRTQVWPSLFGR